MAKSSFVHDSCSGVVALSMPCGNCGTTVNASGVGECNTTVDISGTCSRCGGIATGRQYLGCK